MRNVLAITVALMIAAIVLMPALGYTNQAAGNQAYSAKSGDRPAYDLTSGTAAHNLTPDMLENKYSFKSTAVTSTRMPYSFKQSGAVPYSFNLVGVDNAVAEGMKIKKNTALLGSMNKQTTTSAATESTAVPVTEAANIAETTASTPATVAENTTEAAPAPVAEAPAVAPVAAAQPVAESVTPAVNETAVAPALNETAVAPALNETAVAPALNNTINNTINTTINSTV